MEEPTDTFDERHAAVVRIMNRGRLQQALALAIQLAHDFPDTYHSWYLIMLIQQQCGYMQEARITGDRMDLCADFDAVAMGDLMRDELLDAIRRRRRPNVYSAYVDYIERVHADDPQRLACLIGVRGRYEYLVGGWYRAVRLHQQADTGLTSHKQWQANNLLPLLKALCIVGGNPSERRGAYQRIVAICPPRKPDPSATYLQSRATLHRAWLCHYGGLLGTRLDDLAQWVYWRCYKGV